MDEFLQYVFSATKNKRIAKHEALDLINLYRKAALLPQGVEGGAHPLPSVAASSRLAWLHPLVHRNTSDLGEQRYSSRLSGEEFYLRDHVVAGHRVLPAAAHLELAREAVRRALGGKVEPELRNVVFARPVVVGPAGLELHIALQALDDGTVEWEIYSSASGAGGERGDRDGLTEAADRAPGVVVCSQGRAIVRGDVLPSVPLMDVAGLRGRGTPVFVPGDAGADLNADQLANGGPATGAAIPAQLYELFDRIGVSYGASFRVLGGVWSIRATDGRMQALGELRLPREVASTLGEYVLHPSLLDGALQSCVGLEAGLKDHAGSESLHPQLPFALDRLEVFAPLPERCWALVRGDVAGGMRKLDIEIADETGRVCARLSGFSSRALREELPEADAIQTLLLRGQWASQEECQEAALQEASPPAPGEHWIVMCEVGDKATEPAIGAELPQARCMRLQRPDGAGVDGAGEAALMASPIDLAVRYTIYAQRLLKLVCEILARKPRQAVLVQLVVPSQGIGASVGGLLGLLKSAQQENPRLLWQLLAVEADVEGLELARRIKREAALPGSQVRYFGGGLRQQLRLDRVAADAVRSAGDPASCFWKAGGVYLITGGAGGLGLVFARSIAQRAAGATLVLVGRSAPGEQIDKRLRELEGLGARPRYLAVDIADRDRVQALVSQIVAADGRLDGVIHSAGVLRDSFVLNKSAEQLQEVFAPKVTGLVNLDMATRGLGLECFVVFSSISALFGNVGQADYAAANAFMDGYVQWRNEQVAAGLAHGRTLSIDWPLWAEGGMQVPLAVHERVWREAGMAVLPTQAGIEALDRALALEAAQVAVLSGSIKRIEQALRERARNAPAAAERTSSVSVSPGTEELQGKVQAALTAIVSEQLKITGEDIDVDVPLSEFGFDSIGLIGFGNALNERYGLQLSATAFFEHPTLQELATHLVGEHAQVLAGHFTLSPDAAPRAPGPVAFTERQPTAPGMETGRRHKRNRLARVQNERIPVSSSAPDPIAIIGMSGRFPQARNIGELWHNLLQGRDCIGELPLERLGLDANELGRQPAGLLEGADQFDPLFFGISPREAKGMDPQQRVLMMSVWAALEDAGYAPHSLAGSATALLIGTGSSGYDTVLARVGGSIEGHSAAGLVPSIGPNRMSYFLDLHGPSEPIETACSSALVAIHRAVQLLQSGQCALAITGGVNVLASPGAHISFLKAGMLSADGRCKTFSAQADGYVRGEGAGMLVLKKLSAAERDGDHIYALIRGSAQNHGGRANSLTAPNPRAQAELIKAALRQAQVAPHTVSYIEAHGTGTALGDPVEVQGLKSAFKELAQELDQPELAANSCALGSVKSNIGHLELAAGVAGVIKTVLQLRHRTLVKSLHSEPLNPLIELKDSPFYIAREAQPWPTARDAAGRPLPRRAGVSSFGFGGVNAHVVLEEYVAAELHEEDATAAAGPSVVVVSAKNEERLKEQVRQLLAALQNQAQLTEASEAEGLNGSPRREGLRLCDVAYTLQVGREAMEWRLACVVNDLPQLCARLEAWLGGDNAIEDLYQGHARQHKEALGLFAEDELQETISKWIERGKLSKLAELWAKGLAFDWGQLYGDGRMARPRRVSLPTYPFAKERYWIDTSASRPVREGGESNVAVSGQPIWLHPLVHRNTSDLSEQRYSSRLSGEEFYLRDHVVAGHRILPAAAQLELAREAVRRALGDGEAEAELRNVVFVRPVVVGPEGLELHIALHAQEDGAVEWEIYSFASSKDGLAEAADGEPGVVEHSQGRAELAGSGEHGSKPLYIDIAGLRSRGAEVTAAGAAVRSNLSGSAERAGPSAPLYELFERKGLAYGRSFQVLGAVWSIREVDGRRLALGELRLPQGVASTFGDYVLHPSLLDGALQASAWLEGAEDGELRLPFALDRLEVFAALPERCWALVRRGADTASGLRKLDIEIAEETGQVCARLSGFSSRALQEELAQPATWKKSDPADEQYITKLTSAVPDVSRLASIAPMVGLKKEKPQRIVLRPLESGTLSLVEIASVQAEHAE